MRMLAFWIAVVALGCAAILLSPGQAQETADFPGCHGFISHSCCCTSNGCFDIPNDDAEYIGGDEWFIRSRNEIVKRTGWSKNEKTWLCTNVFENGAFSRIGDPTAPVKCFWPVPRNMLF